MADLDPSKRLVVAKVLLRRWLRSDLSHSGSRSVSCGLMLLWALALAGGAALDLPALRALEQAVQVSFFRLRGPVAPPESVVVLAIDDASLSLVQNASAAELAAQPDLELIAAWPWRRAAYAQALDRLFAAGARAVAIDVLFVEPSLYGPQDDALLKAGLARYGSRVALAVSYESGAAQGGSTLRLASLASAVSPGSAAGGLPRRGFTNFLNSPTGQVLALGEAYASQVLAPLGFAPALPSFAQATLLAANLAPRRVLEGNINAYGPPQTFPTLSFADLFLPEAWQHNLKRGAVFRDKIVLIGPTATSLQDFHRTPFSNQMPGVEIHANAVATLIQDRVLQLAPAQPSARGLLVLLVAGGLGLLATLPERPVARLAILLVSCGVWTSVGYLGFVFAHQLLPVAAPTAALGLGGLCVLIASATTDQLEKLRLRRILEHRVAAPVLQEIMSQREDWVSLLRGRRLQAAVLFADIRGFTRFSTESPPEQVVEQLNSYFDRMVEAIISENGTVDKFIGDAVMAEFGSPRPRQPQTDALSAVRAALKMRETLADLRRIWQAEGKPPLFNGIGISYGEVIAGDIGSQRRAEYTVIGDTVNVASRIEGLTKQLQTDIVITDSLYELVADQVTVQALDAYPLRGRPGKTQLYALISLKDAPALLYTQVQTEFKAYLESQAMLGELGEATPES